MAYFCAAVISEARPRSDALLAESGPDDRLIGHSFGVKNPRRGASTLPCHPSRRASPASPAPTLRRRRPERAGHNDRSREFPLAHSGNRSKPPASRMTGLPRSHCRVPKFDDSTKKIGRFVIGCRIRPVAEQHFVRYAKGGRQRGGALEQHACSEDQQPCLPDAEELFESLEKHRVIFLRLEVTDSDDPRATPSAPEILGFTLPCPDPGLA